MKLSVTMRRTFQLLNSETEAAAMLRRLVAESRREHLHTQEQLNKLKQEYENLKCQKQLKST